MSGDLVACQFLKPARGRYLCEIRVDPETMECREAECLIGIGGTCPWPGLREREIRRREAANWTAELEARTRARNAIEYARRRLALLAAAFGRRAA